MKVHLIKEKTIRNFALANTSSKIPFEGWLVKLKNADWETPADIKATFAFSDLLGRSSLRVIFNIGGYNYRMICKYAFGDTTGQAVCMLDRHAC
jgi:mRNA interferase HigB